MPTNFLAQLTQAGALNVANPMESYRKAQQYKAMKTNIRGAELDNEGKVLEIGKGYLQRVRNKKDLDGWANYMVDTLGVNPSFRDTLKDVQTDEEVREFVEYGTLSADARLKANQGLKFPMHNKKTGSVDKNMTHEKLDELDKAGVINKEDWEYGEKPWKSPERLKEEAAAKRAPEKGKTITLSPGQIVVDETGKEIARAPEKEKTKTKKTITLSPGQIVVDETGKEIARGQEIAEKAPKPTLKSGKNPSSGKDEWFYLDEKNEPQWIGIETGEIDPTKELAFKALVNSIVGQMRLAKMSPQEIAGMINKVSAAFKMEPSEEEITAINPETNERVRWNSKTNDWEPIK